jgi:hypothetical protein
MGRLAILLFGIHYQENFTGNYRKNHTIDFRQYKDNFNDKIINHFRQNYDIDIFLSTNPSRIQNELENTYHFKDALFTQDRRNQKISKGLQLILNYQERNNFTYDQVLITRFDIFIVKNFNEYHLDSQKLNLVSILEHKNAVDDNFYFFPQKYISNFHSIFKNSNGGDGHGYRNTFEQQFDVHYFCNEHRTVSKLSFYKIRYFLPRVEHLPNLPFNIQPQGGRLRRNRR